MYISLQYNIFFIIVTYDYITSSQRRYYNLFTIKHINSLDDIDKSTWDATINSNIPHLKYDYLKVLENSFKENLSFYYLLIYKDDQLIVTTTAFIKSDFYLDSAATYKYKKVCNNMRKVYKNFLKHKALICGSPISEFNHLNICSEYITFRNDILKLIIQELNLIAKENKINMVLFKDIKCENLDKKLIFNNCGYTRFYSMPGTQLSIPFSSFDEYLKTLKIGFRNTIESKINRSKNFLHLTVEIVSDFSPYINDIYKLYLNTYNKSEVKPEKLTKNFFYELKNILGDSVCSILCKLDGRLCGVTILLNSNATCTTLCFGLDYSVAHKYDLYYLMLYKSIEYSIENNKKTLLLGQTNYISKIELNAKLTPLIIYVKFNNILKSKMYLLLFNMFLKQYTILMKSQTPMRDLKKFFMDSNI